VKRRRFVQRSLLASTAALSPALSLGKDAYTQAPEAGLKLKNNIHHSVCYWCYDSIELDSFLGALAAMGVKAIDLVGPDDWPLLKKHGIHASMCWGAELNLTDGWNDPKFHEQLIANYSEMIPRVAAAGYTNLICFSGNRRGMDDLIGLQHCVEGLSQVLPLAEKHGVVLQMELLNSKVDHKDYMCDHTLWGVELCRRLATPNFKLLFDIYHMQIMEGDIIRTIKEYHSYIGHYHTGGNPGRHEIDESQELNYPAIMKAILDTGFTGHVAQEFIPSWEDKLAALQQGISICDV
jgi:hydroxypyruvate isomerase